MSSSSPNEDSKSKTVANYLDIPKYSWETETQCDEFTQEIPTYSWEYDTCSPIHNEDSTSTIVPDSQCLPNIHHIPKFSWETETQCDEYTKDIPTYSWEADSCSPAKVLSPKFEDGLSFSQHKYDKQPECHDQKRVVDEVSYRQIEDVQPSQLIEKSDTYGASTSNECTDHFYANEFAQRPESPNLNLDVDAINRELCDGFVDSPQKKQKGKKSFWF